MKKKILLIVAIFIVAVSVAACGKAENSEAETETETEAETGLENSYSWPNNKFAKMIPQMDDADIVVLNESDSYTYFEIGEATEEKFTAYVNNCKNNSGFTVDYSGGLDFYYAHDEDGYYLMLNHDIEDKTINIAIYAPKENSME